MAWTLKKLLALKRMQRRHPMVALNCRCVTVPVEPHRVEMLIPPSTKHRLELALSLLQGIKEEEVSGPAMLTSLRTAKRALLQAAERSA